MRRAMSKMSREWDPARLRRSNGLFARLTWTNKGLRRQIQ